MRVIRTIEATNTSIANNIQATIMTEQRKAVIKNADMSEDMQQDAVDIASQALAKYNIEKVRPPCGRKVHSSHGFAMRSQDNFRQGSSALSLFDRVEGGQGRERKIREVVVDLS